MKQTTLAVFAIVLASGSALAAQGVPPVDHAAMGFLGGIVVFHTGILIGAIGTLIGAGGGFLHVPILMIFYGFSPQHAIGTSMTVVMLNAISGTFAYVSQKRIDYDIGLKFATAACPGVVAGALLTRFFTVKGFGAAFGLLLILVSYYLFSDVELSVVRTKAAQAPTKRYLKDVMGEEYTYAPDMSVGLAASVLIGKLSGLFGIGGGIIHVPLMYSVLGIPVHVATATSHFILAITSFFGFIIFVGLGYVDLNYAVALGVGTILGATWGAHLSLRTPPSVIKKIIAVCLSFLALKLILGEG